MLLSKIENMELKNVNYYILIVWTNKNAMGVYFPIAYKKKGNAEKRMNKLINSGLYELITMRKEDVTLRDAHTETSDSQIEKIWEI